MRGNSFIKKLTISTFAFIGLLTGIFLFYSIQDKSLYYAAAAGALVVTALLIAVIVRQGSASGKVMGEEKGSEVGFVVDTFQDLVGKLKEKERELEKLKAVAEEKAGSIEAYNENILQSVPSGVVSIDNEMVIKSINRAASEILGAEIKAVIGKRPKEVFNEPLAELMSAGDALSRGEYRYVTSDNRHVWLGITTSTLRNMAGEQIGRIFVFSDLTGIKALQDQLELRQRLSQLGEMSAGIAHEMRNSMAVISGYVKLAAKKGGDEVQSAVEPIAEEIKNMDSIISELLAFAKPSVLNREKVDMAGLIKGAADTAFRGHDNIEFILNSPAELMLNADRVLMRQVFSNMFINAVDAISGNGIIETDLVRRGDTAEIRIKDSGPGIPEEIRQKIFLPFFTTKDEGVGFGLALVQKIIISHGGSIEVRSSEGPGTVFMITIPVE